jgi:fatty-acid desaturase
MSERTREWANRIGLGAIHAGALAAFVPALFHWSGPVVAAALLWITGGLGITLCYHRTLTHRGLRLRKPLEYVLAVFGALAIPQCRATKSCAGLRRICTRAAFTARCR